MHGTQRVWLAAVTLSIAASCSTIQELDNHTLKLSEDPIVVGYVQGLLDQLTADSKTHWKLHVIDEGKQVNAFATPGGHMYVNTALLMAAHNESEIIGVLAHELGHAEGRHGMYLVLDGEMFTHSKSDELLADEFALRAAAKAGYDPRGVAMFARRLELEQGHKKEFCPLWLSRHPLNAARIAHVNSVISVEHLWGPRVGAAPLLAIQERLDGGRLSWR
jgi:predicted Zn-dependent protease